MSMTRQLSYSFLILLMTAIFWLCAFGAYQTKTGEILAVSISFMSVIILSIFQSNPATIPYVAYCLLTSVIAGAGIVGSILLIKRNLLAAACVVSFAISLICITIWLWTGFNVFVISTGQPKVKIWPTSAFQPLVPVFSICAFQAAN
jgi:hypothetical protein